MASNFYNPLDEVSLGLTLLRGFRDKLNRTYSAFAGSRITGDSEHVGFFDYFTLFIPLGIDFVTKWCWQNVDEKLSAKILIIPATILTLGLNAARYSASFALTIAFIWLTGIVSIVSQIIAAPLKAQLGNAYLETTEVGFVAQTRVSEYMNQRRLTFDSPDLLIELRDDSRLAIGRKCGSMLTARFRSGSMFCESCERNESHAHNISFSDANAYSAARRLGFFYRPPNPVNPNANHVGDVHANDIEAEAMGGATSSVVNDAVTRNANIRN